MKHRISSSNERVWCTTQLAKSSFNHSICRTHSWRFSIFYKINTNVCRGIQIGQRACVNQLVLRDDWNPSEFESSYDIPYWIPGCCILSPSGGIVSVFCIQANVIPVPHTSGRSCQHWSIQSWIRIHFGRCRGTVVFDLLRFGISFSS